MKYIKHVLLTAAVCVLVPAILWLRGETIEVGVYIACFFASIAFTSLVVIRLPVFRQFYSAMLDYELKKYRGFANYKAAPVMAGLVTGVFLGVCLYLFGVGNLLGPAFLGAVASAVMSLYHEKIH